MLSLLRSNLFRMVKAPISWGFAIVFAVSMCMSTFLVIKGVGPEASSMLQDPSAIVLYGSAFGGATVSLLVVFVSVLFFAADFETGSVKNLIPVRGGRVSYAIAALIIVLVVSIFAILEGVIVTEVAYRCAGVTPIWPAVGDFVGWFVQMMLVAAAYGALAILILFVTQNKTFSLISGLFLAAGTVESLIQMVLANTPFIVPVLRDCLDYYLAADVRMLATQVMPGMGAYVDGLLTFLVAGVLCVLVMQRRNLK